MISLEKAKALKEAGLKWDYVFGNPRDCVYYKGKLNDADGPGAGDTIRLSPWQNYVKRENVIFAPSLSQLLAEIEARYPYLWQVGRVESGRYEMALMDCGYNVTSFEADTPEDACADALLWILEQQASL